MIDNPILGIVIPVYNEEEILEESISLLSKKLNDYFKQGLISQDSFLVLVDDGSSDKTWDIIKTSTIKYPQIKGIKLSNNVGHQRALLSGYHFCTNKVDCAISLDADLQDDINVMVDMIHDFKAGSHQVYGIRKKRKKDTFFKKWTALSFYWLMRKMGVNIVYNHADFRLISNLVLKELGKYQERNIFLRGLFPLMGFKSSEVYYDRGERQAGTTKFSLGKMMSFALDGISSFSNVPLRIISWLGITIFIGTLLISMWVLLVIIQDKNIPGWASTTLPIYFLGGIQLLAIGILGEYLSKIYFESKMRPHYHIEETLV